MNLSVLQAFKALASNFTDCKMFWPNEAVQPPMDAQGQPTSFVWAEMVGLRSEVLSVGTPGAHQMRDDGFLRFHVMAPYGTGLELPLGIAEGLSALFRVTTPDGLTGLQTLAPTPAEGGAQSDDGNYFGVSFSVPFYWLYTG